MAEGISNKTFSDDETSGIEPKGMAEGTKGGTDSIESNTASDENISAVIELIDALPAIEEASETNELLIQEARAAYEALTTEQKLNVANINLLVEKENALASLKATPESNLLTLNLSEEPKGYAYFSIEDFASREDGAEFAEPLGVILERTRVPFYEGDTIADVTVRTLEENGITPGYSGDTKGGFYLSSIQNFTHNGEFIPSFGEFSAGTMSGWMISLNDWFINMGASEFLVTEGDTIRWQYTGQLGMDIGSDWTNQSAQITGLKIGNNLGVLSPAFSQEVKQYTLTVPPNTKFVQVEAEANKLSHVRYYVGEKEYKYLNDIPIEHGTVIKISSIFDDTYSGVYDSDELFITIQDESTYQVNTVVGLINALPKITATDEATQLQLQQARAAYNALNEEQRNLVLNINELVNKENHFKTLKNAQELEQKIADLPTVEMLQWTNKDELEQVAKTYAASTEEVQALITNHDKLEALQQQLSELQPAAITTNQAYNTVGNYMTSKVVNPKFNNEWFILTLARGNYDVPADYYNTYYNNVVEYVKSVEGNLHARKYTEYSRLILALTSIGKDPTDVGGYNLIEKLSDFDKVVWQGVNGAYFGLIALDTWGFELPETATTTREKLIDFILSKQLDDGGFALSGTKSDPDMTAMAIQSLAPYYNQEKVKKAVDTAIDTLATLQLDNGGYKSWGVENVESATQVVTALVSLGIDPANDARFNKVIPNIMTYYSQTDGGFKHVLSEKSSNGMATEQVGYTLAAYKRLLNGQSSLYDMLDTKPADSKQPEQNPDKDKETNLEPEKEDNTTVIEIESKEGKTEAAFTAEDIKQYNQNNVTTIVIQNTQGTKLEIPTSTLASLELAADEKIVIAVTAQAGEKQIAVNLFVETADGTTKAISTGKAYVQITSPIMNAKPSTVVLQSVNGEYKAVPHKMVDGEIIILTKTGGTFAITEETVTFKDITQTFNKEEIEFLASRHIIKGVNAEKFEPNKPITRAQFAVMISRALGLQAAGENTFSDTKGQWYEQDVQALFEAGITTGTTSDTFSPAAYVTRQQAAAFMARVLAYVDFQEQSYDEVNYNDVNKINPEFKQYINLLNSLDIMTGKKDGTFDPYSSLTRAQMAKILKRTLNVANLM